MITYEIHRAAQVFPAMADDDLIKLAEDIKSNGLLHPIELLGNHVIDGRNRLAACDLAGVAPRFVEIQTDDPIRYVTAANLQRRHLSTDQRAAIAAELANLGRGNPTGANQHGGGKGSNDPFPETPPVSIAQAAELMGVSPKSVKRAKARMKADPEAHEAAKRGRPARPEEERPMNAWHAKRYQYGINTGARARLIADLDQRTPGWRSLRGDELLAAYDRSGDVVFAKARKNEPAPQDEPGVIKVKIEEWEEIQRAQAKMQERSEWLFRREREVKQLERHVEMRRAGIAPVMSYDEFAVLRKVLHPDQYPEIPEGDPRRERLQRAFSVVSRLPDSIDEDTPLSVLKRLGWEGHVAGKKRRAA